MCSARRLAAVGSNSSCVHSRCTPTSDHPTTCLSLAAVKVPARCQLQRLLSFQNLPVGVMAAYAAASCMRFDVFCRDSSIVDERTSSRLWSPPTSRVDPLALHLDSSRTYTAQSLI
jgi:hypothetical protein